jgi:Na+/H+-dicarboxylate symporter
MEQADMGLLKRLATSPLFILLCLIGGNLFGWLWPQGGHQAQVIGHIYLSLISLAASPLLVGATFFGLRQVLQLPQPGSRVLMMVGLAVLLVVLCAVLGAALGVLVQPGGHIGEDTRQSLGRLVLADTGDSANVDMLRYDTLGGAGAVVVKPWAEVIPENFFNALAQWQPLAVLSCSILFGLAFAALPKLQSASLMAVFDGIYRALEVIISRVNVLIPLMVFSMSAYFASQADATTLRAMGGFLGVYLFATLMLSVAAIWLIRRSAGLPIGQVLEALKAPALISLTAGSITATIPDNIDAMSTRLGFSRGITELVVPLASVFMRSGAALYFAVMAAFVCNLYGRTVGLEEFGLICVGASLAAFASSGHSNVVAVGFGALVLNRLHLPLEAALALFLVIDILCEGPRNLVTLLFSCVLIVLVSRGLPSERGEHAAAPEMGPAEPIRFVFSRASVAMALACAFLVAILITIAGVGVGMRALEPGARGAPTGEAAPEPRKSSL